MQRLLQRDQPQLGRLAIGRDGDTGAILALARLVLQLASGDMDEAEGQARQIGGLKSPKLQVRFAPAWLSWLPMVWGDYWVIDLDPEYQLVAVSEPKREFLWVLSRTQQVNPAKYEALLQRLKAKGFDLNKLELSPQTN